MGRKKGSEENIWGNAFKQIKSPEAKACQYVQKGPKWPLQLQDSRQEKETQEMRPKGMIRPHHIGLRQLL